MDDLIPPEYDTCNLRTTVEDEIEESIKMKKDIFNALGMNYEIGESKELNKMGIRGFKG